VAVTAAEKARWGLGQPLKDLAELDRYAAVPFPHGHPADRRTFYSPVDQVHAVICRVVACATSSLVLAMYGFADDELARIVSAHLDSAQVYVQLTLDASQAGGVHEKALLAKQNYPANSVAVGRSEKGAIMHLKEGIVDGTDLFTGSTNWSTGGQTRQDNEFTIRRSPLEAIRARNRIDAIHTHMLQVMAATEIGALRQAAKRRSP
jgi:phosphatidylserine/phosphatidylglycerophosphate/cardiolipin synthase-like enzyme